MFSVVPDVKKRAVGSAGRYSWQPGNERIIGNVNKLHSAPVLNHWALHMPVNTDNQKSPVNSTACTQTRKRQRRSDNEPPQPSIPAKKTRKMNIPRRLPVASRAHRLHIRQAHAKTQRKPAMPGFQKDSVAVKSLTQMVRGYVENEYRPKMPVTPAIISGQELTWIYQNGKPKCVGSGSFGSVYLARKGEQVVAIKLYRLRSDHLTATEDVMWEASIYTLLSETKAAAYCHGLVGLDHSDEFLNVGLVLEFLGDPITYQTVTVANMKYMPESVHLDWPSLAQEMSEKLEKVHQKGIMINDIKPDNMIMRKVDGQWTTYFIDFGLAAHHTGENVYITVSPEAAQSTMERYPYSAPEYITCGQSTPESDVYSLGSVFRDIAQSTGAPLFDMAAQCMKLSPSERPSAADVTANLNQIATMESIFGTVNMY